MKRIHLFAGAALLATLPGAASAVTPSAEEIRAASEWVTKHLSPGGRLIPFSFVYGGKPSLDLLTIWAKQIDRKELDPSRTQHTFSWTDDNTGLEVRCVAVVYSRFPVVEWTVYFTNTGTKDTPILEHIQALDARIERQTGPEFVLHHHRGDFNLPESYQPFAQLLFENVTQTFSPVGGRPTNSAFPYWDVQMPGGGIILAVGWPGQWATMFKRDAGRGLLVRAGQELTHLRLKPGEEIRSPLVALLFWKGADTVRAQNLWRRWMLEHNTPHPGGKLPQPIYTFCDGAFFPGLKTSEAGEKQFIDVLTREGIKPDYWWIDAGWYPCGNNWANTGTWEPDPVRYPRGIKAVSDYAHARGMKLVVWFEPERATGGSWLAQNHPEWLLGGRLLNLGNPDARRWVTNHVDALIREQGIDLYRQDFNMDPLDCWRNNDPPDRQGITENLYVRGYLAYWDELRKRHTDMLIDSCASGGRRNDLETLRRALPLLRSDYQSFGGGPEFALGNQAHTYGLSSWLPYYGQGVYVTPRDPVYYARSHTCPAFGIAVDVRRPGIDWHLYRRLVSEWRQVADRMMGDYYPLTPYSLRKDEWIAWQFDRPEYGDGVVQAFRREMSRETSKRFRLSGIDRAARYKVTDLDAATPWTVSGRELLEKGVPVVLQASPGAAVLTYEKVR